MDDDTLVATFFRNFYDDNASGINTYDRVMMLMIDVLDWWSGWVMDGEDCLMLLIIEDWLKQWWLMVMDHDDWLWKFIVEHEDW